ncbi:DUF4253 domain-containing protein [Streptomyces californicus]|uniref:DUF4253 domain-containing protein n=1 Tax=Streptomyces californicus TaxID=67351 RepID=A0ABD7D1Y2_9ACTN|nr:MULTISPECIES: DUF4253 domain-containing protein [Streptomyces]QRV29316.1 DUF4253 domain-containing protein [Streptomyces californicus]QRV35078.1 DUF4253 domain-containing protein [Streptomyces californicus]QRV42729.1 DUF4253 domain-containing protein [Streptomyces californicus]QRV49416.1 DUF4253 domain-containing protein [Streptomyces californicus]
MATLPNPLPDPAAAGLDLPPGSLVDATLDGPWHEPLLWYADGAADQGDWAGLRAAGRRVGLLPVLVTGGQRDQWPEAWDLSPDSASYPGDHDPEEVLAGYWTDYADDELGDAAPADGASGEPGDGASGEPETGSGTETGSGSGSAGAWPGLAPVPARETAEDPDTAAAGIVAVVAGDADLWLGGTRMALVPARRSADIPAAIGWTGAVNHENDVARLCAVLRSWEDRYDARVVVLGFDTMIVSVGRPPATMEEARALAAEHYAFCPDNIDQSPPYDLDAYAEKAVLDQDAWSFWWD